MRVVALLLSCCALAAAQDATRRHFDQTKKYSVALPSAWKVEPGDYADKPLLAFKAKLLGLDYWIHFELYPLQGISDCRSQAIRERRVLGDRHEATSSVAALEPAPHISVAYERDGRKRLRVVAYRMHNRVGMSFNLFCDEADWPQLEKAYWAAFASLRTDLPEWPPTKDGYERAEHDGYIYLRHPDASKGDEKKLHAWVRKQEKEFEKFFGPVPKPPESRPMIALHERVGDFRHVGYEGDEQAYMQIRERRLVTLFLPRPRTEKRARLACELHQLFLTQTFGAFPDWMYYGEAEYVKQRALHRRRGTVTGELKRQLPVNPVRFADLVAWADHEKCWPGAAAVVLFFREGPRDYRKAYEAFVEELATTGDWPAAEKKHLLSLDQEKLSEDLAKFLARLRVAD